MLNLKSATSSQSIKNGSFETWVLVVVSIVKTIGAESDLPLYMQSGGVNVFDAILSFSKLKEKGKEKSEDDDEGDQDHQTLLSTH